MSEETQVLYVTRDTGDSHRVVSYLQGWGIVAHEVSSCIRSFARLVEAAEAGTPVSHVLLEESRIDMDPIEFAHAVRADKLLRETRLILITSAHDDEHRDRLRDAGYAALLSVPVDKTLLFNAVHDMRPLAGGTEQLPSFIEHYSQLRPRAALDILVAAPDEISRRSFKHILERSGHRVFLVSDGDQALQALEEHVFDVAVVDLDLTGMSGPQVAKVHRFTHLARIEMPFVLIAEDPNAETMKAAKEAGIDAVIGKPAQPQTLLDTIHRLVDYESDTAPAKETDLAARRLAALNTTQDNLPALDVARLKELEALGSDSDFLHILSEHFRVDTEFLLEQMAGAAQRGKHAEFIELAQALKGNAASIGAVVLYELSACACRLGPSEFGAQATELVAKMATAFATARENLADYLLERSHNSTKR